jgi:formylglycine-generating enzyme required for sulfatase activity
MLDQLRRRVSFANVTSLLALFVALGGVAYAVTTAPKNSVVSNSITNGQVKSPDLANGAVTSTKLACKGNSAQDKMVRAGSVCIDRYEDSIWTKKTGGQRITGTIPCNVNGQDCKGKIFARSVKGVIPRASITWFQAQQALANSGKRLPTNAEWQMAVAGTPDSTACNVSSGSVQNTGANPGCRSDWGANDMVGNLWEWVADWDEEASDNNCANWPAGLGSDRTCVGGADPATGFPGALYRGGCFECGTGAGPFAIVGSSVPDDSDITFGLRGAR